jgi:hypothetical protein
VKNVKINASNVKGLIHVLNVQTATSSIRIFACHTAPTHKHILISSPTNVNGVITLVKHALEKVITAHHVIWDIFIRTNA